MKKNEGLLSAYVKKIAIYFQKGSFAKNVLNVALGSGAAVSVNVIAAPILTRLYTPDEFGVFAVFMSVSSILAVIASGRYELAIVQAEDKEEASVLVYLCGVLSIAVGLIFTLLVFVFGEQLEHAVGLPYGLVTAIIPGFILLLSITQALNNWLNWRQRYSLLGASRTVRNLGTFVSQVVANLIGGGAVGLCGGRVFGSVSFIGAGISDFLQKRSRISLNALTRKIKEMVRKHSRFPLYTLPSALVNKANVKVAEILLISLFSSSAAGLYALTKRVLDRPLSFLGKSVKEVFYRRFADSHREGGPLVSILMKTTVGMAAIITPPLTVMYFFAPDIMAWAFGEEWGDTAAYVRVMIPAIATQITVRATALSMYVVDKQNIVLIWTIIFFCLSTVAIFIGKKLYDDPVTAIALLSATHVIMYSVYWVVNVYYACKEGYA